MALFTLFGIVCGLIISTQGATIVNYLNYQACVYGNSGQQFQYDNQTKLIQLMNKVNDEEICAVSDNSSFPVGMTMCNPSDTTQQWVYTSNKFFQSVAHGTCLDVYQQQGPEVDEWTCKSPTDPTVANQQWFFNYSQIISENRIYGDFCLTSVPYK